MINVVAMGREQLKSYKKFSRKYYQNRETIDLEFLRWKFRVGTPAASQLVTFSKKKDVVGRVVLSARQVAVNRNNFILTQVSDLLIDPNLRDPSCLLGLVSNYGALNSDFIMHTSNSSSDDIYKKLFKFPIAFMMKSYVVPITVSSLAAKFFELDFLARLLIPIDWMYQNFLVFVLRAVAMIGLKSHTTVGLMRVEKDQFYEFFHTVNPSQILRHEAFLKWRYQETPNAYEQVIVEYENGWALQAIFCVTTVEKKRVLVLMEVFANSRISLLMRCNLMKELMSLAIKRKVDLIYTIINPSNQYQNTVVGFPFLPVPDSVLPHSTPIYFRCDASSVDITSVSSIYFSAGDLDYF